jgi:hypothetical protein
MPRDLPSDLRLCCLSQELMRLAKVAGRDLGFGLLDKAACRGIVRIESGGLSGLRLKPVMISQRNYRRLLSRSA